MKMYVRQNATTFFCAAKIIHPTQQSFTQLAPNRQHSLPIGRFQLECEFLCTVQHPNIVQYLGTNQDPDTGLSGLPWMLV